MAMNHYLGHRKSPFESLVLVFQNNFVDGMHDIWLWIMCMFFVDWKLVVRKTFTMETYKKCNKMKD